MNRPLIHKVVVFSLSLISLSLCLPKSLMPFFSFAVSSLSLTLLTYYINIFTNNNSIICNCSCYYIVKLCFTKKFTYLCIVKIIFSKRLRYIYVNLEIVIMKKTKKIKI